jgi:hypothetical protein
VTSTTASPNEPIGPVIPLTVAESVEATPVESWPKLIVPKFAKGRISPEDEDGASAIQSAELIWGPLPGPKVWV